MNYTDVGYVYAITNKVNGKAYIGSTITLPRLRWNTHKSALSRGVHHSYKLQSGWNKYGKENFEFLVLLVCEKSAVISYEQKLMPEGRYNVLQAGETYQSKRWEGHIKKPKSPPVDLSALRKKQWADPKFRARMIAGIRRAASTPEAKEKRSKISTNRLHTATTKAKIAKTKSTPIFCPELKVSFLSQLDAAKFLNSSRAAVNNAVMRNTKVRGQYALEKIVL